MIKVDLSGAAGFFDPAGPDYAAAAQAHRTLLEHTGAGKDFTGWLDLPGHMQNGELKQILAAASRIRGRSQALVVVGIGGSYLGARGVVECLCSPNYNLKKKDTPNIYFIDRKSVV